MRIKELPGCVSQGETPEETLAMISDAMRGWLEVTLESGDPIPEPREEAEFSGKFMVRLPRSLHRRLVELAQEEGVSLNQYINTILASAANAPFGFWVPAQHRMHIQNTVHLHEKRTPYTTKAKSGANDHPQTR